MGLGPRGVPSGTMHPEGYEPPIMTRDGQQTTPTALAMDVLSSMPPPARAVEIQRMQASPDEYRSRGIQVEKVIANLAKYGI